MFYLKKTLEFAASHQLTLPYESKCNRLHGHTYRVVVYCKREELNENGMVLDFNEIKGVVMKLDHSHLNDSIPNPTAENIAKFLFLSIPYCYKIEVSESPSSEVTYVGD